MSQQHVFLTVYLYSCAMHHSVAGRVAPLGLTFKSGLSRIWPDLGTQIRPEPESDLDISLSLFLILYSTVCCAVKLVSSCRLVAVKLHG